LKKRLQFEFTTLTVNEEGSDDEEIDNDFGDNPTLQSGTKSPGDRSQPFVSLLVGSGLFILGSYGCCSKK